MSVKSEIDRIERNIADTYSAAAENGAVIPEQQNSDNLAETVRSISLELNSEALNTILAMWDTIRALQATSADLSAQLAEKEETVQRLSPMVNNAKEAIREAILFMHGEVAPEASFADFPEAIKTVHLPAAQRMNQLLGQFPYVGKVIWIDRLRGFGTASVSVVTKDCTAITEEQAREIKDWLLQYCYNLSVYYSQEHLDRDDVDYPDILVCSPQNYPIDITVAVKPADGYDFETQLKPAIRTAFEEFFTFQLFGKGVSLDDIGSVVASVPGVESYSVKKPTSDYAANLDYLCILGSLLVYELT